MSKNIHSPLVDNQNNGSSARDDCYCTLADSSMIGYWQSRISDGLVLYVNKALLNELGIDNSNKIVGRYKLSDMYPSKERYKLVELLKTEGKISNYEIKLNFPPDNREEYFLISARYLPAKNYVEGISINITKRKQAEERMKKSERKYRNLVENISDGLIIIDNEKNIIFANASACDIFGVAREDLIGINLDNIVDDSDREMVTRSLKTMTSRKGGKYNISLTADSIKKIQIQYSISPYLNEDEVVSGGVIIFSDTSAANKIDSEKKQLQIQLEKARRMESIGILAGGVAHDLNNILGPLVAYPEMILMKMDEESPLRKKIEMMGNCARDAADVIQDLLTLARRGRYEMIPIDFNEVIESYLASANMADLRVKNPDINVNINMDDSIGKISGSTTHLLKMVMNLVVNAFDAISEQGTITIETSQQFMDKLPGDSDKIDRGDYIVLKVSDTGMGIEKKYIKRIFEPYFSKKEMGSSGSGLGLSVVYGILKDHRGYYDIISEPGQGTQFVLYFPVTLEEAEIVFDDTNEYRGTESVLVVDDNDNQRQIALDLLRDKGYRAESADNGHEALELIMKNEYDIVLLDMIMEKDFDGLDTYKEIIKIREDQKVIIVSGFSATSRVNKVLKLGACQYLKKPYTCTEMARMIRKELDCETAKIPIKIT